MEPLPKPRKVTFKQFLSTFSTIELPFQLSGDSHTIFDKENKTLPIQIMDQFLPELTVNHNEYVEYIPCIKHLIKDGLYGLIVWKADLLVYDFILITITNKGEYIDHKPICGMHTDGDLIFQSVANFDEDFLIHVIENKNEATNGDIHYDASSSKVKVFDINERGLIVESV